MNLRDLVRDILSDSEFADPGDIAETAVNSLQTSQLREALRCTMRSFVRDVIRAERQRSAESQAPEPATKSSKVQSIRTAWQQRLRDRIHVGNGEWKFLKDCGYADLLAAAGERRAIAERNIAQAERFEAWAKLVHEHGVETFGELPEDAQGSELKGAA